MADFQETDQPPVRGRVFSPDAFDLKIILDRKFRSQITGCSTFSLTQATSDLSPRSISIRPYYPDDSVRIELDGEVHEQVFGRQEQEGLEYIYNNRNKFGRYWAAVELAREFNVPDSLMFPEHEYLSHEFIRVFEETERLGRREDIKNAAQSFIERSIGERKSDFLRAFGDWEALTDFLIKLKERGGVQVVYGGGYKSAFIDFIRGQKHKSVDDRGVEIYSSIPNRFILAVVPLGKYEQRQIRKYV